MRSWLALAALVAITAWVIRTGAATWVVAICIAGASGTLAVMVSNRIVEARRKRRQ